MRRPSGLEHDRHRVGDRVRHADELRPERPDLDGAVLGLRLSQLGRLRAARARRASTGAAQRQPRGPDLAAPAPRAAGTAARRRGPRAMGQHDGSHPAGPLPQVREVGQDQVDAEMLVARECEPGVDDDEVAVGLETVMFLPTSPSPPSGVILIGANLSSVPFAQARLDPSRGRADPRARGLRGFRPAPRPSLRRAAGVGRRPRGRADSARP